jgi:hypothetical protein
MTTSAPSCHQISNGLYHGILHTPFPLIREASFQRTVSERHYYLLFCCMNVFPPVRDARHAPAKPAGHILSSDSQN